jgi:hypothetical protein
MGEIGVSETGVVEGDGSSMQKCTFTQTKCGNILDESWIGEYPNCIVMHDARSKSNRTRKRTLGSKGFSTALTIT